MTDLAKEGDFKPDHLFDIVHARFVSCHLIMAGRGLLLMEDIDALCSRLLDRCLVTIYDMEFGRKTSDLIRALGDFPDVQVQKMSMPFGGNGPDDALNPLGLATKKIYIRTVDSVAEYLAPRGFTLEMALKYREELENEKDNSVDIYCCWALFQ
ncbi:hypothetical protein B0H14DRAFT_3129254 [Mycena olivaceomarginata]|nr:hypothetical protein B0H14DRAFT_3129254 [Mycena olivaceomarginata]